MVMNFLSVAIGGAIGAMARYGVGLYVTSSALAMPAFFATLLVNMIGCALMGIMAALLPVLPALQGAPKHLIMIGFLGALTTFSAFAYDSAELLQKQHYGMMASYMIASFTLSLAAFFACYHLTKITIIS